MYLTYALQKALDSYPSDSGVNWSAICDSVVDDFNKNDFLPVPKIKMGRTLQRWFVSFKRNDRKIVVPSISNEDDNEIRKPPILEAYPDFYNSLVEFCSLNIGELNADIVHTYINNCVTIISNNKEKFQTVVEIDEDDKTRDETVEVDLPLAFQKVGKNC